MKFICCYLMIGLLLFAAGPVYAQCGNPSSAGPSNPPPKEPPPPGDPFHPFTGNEHRVVNDLEIWNSVGEIPMVWKRYYNSREFIGFTYSFQYTMTDAGINSQLSPQISISSPDGSQVIFAQSLANPALWLPPSGVEERVFQDGTNFFLQNSDGHRYRFKKIINPEGSFYVLQDFRDSQQNLYTLAYNSPHGGLSRVTDPAGRYFDISYTIINLQPFISTVTTNDGRSVHYNYTIQIHSAIGWPLLTSADYGDGTQATYKYHSPHFSLFGFLYLEHAIDPRYAGDHGNMRFTYDNNIARGYIKEEINGKTGHVMATLTSAPGNRWVCYANGRVQHYVMPDDLLGKTTAYTDGLGRTTNYTFNANGFIETETDVLNRTTAYVTTSFGNPLEITYPDGTKEKWTRDDLDRILTYTDELNRVTTYTRDNLHRATKVVYPDGTEERFTYNGFGQVLTYTRRNGGVESNAYNSKGLKTSHTDALGNVTVYAYDGADRLAFVTDAQGHTTRYEYNERGLRIKMINADNSFQLYTYDDFGNPTSITNEIGNTWTKVFDEFKRIVSSTDPLNRQTVYSYDLPGGVCGCAHDQNMPTRITSPAGKITAIEYDEEWQKTKETTGANTLDAATTFYEYDAGGNLATMIDPLSKSWTYEYDVQNRQTSATDPLGNKTRWTHDVTGNVLTETRPDNGVTSNTYDLMDRLIQTTDPKGQVTTMSYDNEGNMARLKDPANENYDFEYDLLNRRKKMIYPGGSFESYTYDAVGNLTAYTNRAGHTRTYLYDNRDRETLSAWIDGTPAVTTNYDAAGRVLMLSSTVSTLTYTYNAGDELTAETQNITGATGARQVGYTYNADGLMKNIIYPGGLTTVHHDYTSRNKVATISINGENLVSYGNDLNGNRIAQFRKNQTGTSYTYDDDNRTLSITHQRAGTGIAHFDYGYDNTDRKTFVRRNYDKGDVYDYDAVDQIANVQYNASSPHTAPSGAVRTVNYSYGPTGNRTQVLDNGTATAYVANNLNQYTAVGGAALTYNANGNLITHNGWTYTYDAQGRLINAANDSTTASFAYDARNRCVLRTINGISSFLYYEDWNLVEEINAAGAVTGQYIHGAFLDEIIVKHSGNDTVYYHYDDLGNVTQLTDASGNMVEQYSYDVFGQVSIKNATGGSIAGSAFANRFLFTGREFIPEIGLYDYRNRMYSPLLGRFLETDPIGFAAGDVNLYRYVGNDPINKTDPSGLKKKDEKEKKKKEKEEKKKKKEEEKKRKKAEREAKDRETREREERRRQEDLEFRRRNNLTDDGFGIQIRF